jgi:hypothetical protein
MRRRQSFVHQVEKRIFDFEKQARVETQTMRTKWIGKLDKLFDLANSFAVNDEQEEGKSMPVPPKERQMWAHVAAHVGMVMGNLSKGYDETRFNEDLAELERQIGEIKRLQAQVDQEGTRNTEQQPSEKVNWSADANTSNS